MHQVNSGWVTEPVEAVEANPPFSLFTTTRYTSPGTPRRSIERQDIPLLDRHIARLKSAWAYFTKRDGREVWGDWPGDEVVWKRIKEKVQESEREGGGDWRVSPSIQAACGRDADAT
jgi:hypothetical protein